MQPNEQYPFGGQQGQPAPQQPQQPGQPGQSGVVVPGGMQQPTADQVMARFGQPVSPQVVQAPVIAAPEGTPGTVPAVVVPQNHIPLWAWITLSLLGLLTIGGAVFGYWAFGERQTYKNDTDQIVAQEVDSAKALQLEQDNARFAEEAKKPLKPYTGPSAFGSVNLLYPKTWSGYIDIAPSGGTEFSALFHPDTVPAQTGRSAAAVALKVEVIATEYSSMMRQRETKVKSGELTATAYVFPKQPEQIGTRFVGKITSDLTGTEILVPLRDKTIVVTTQTEQFLKDFNENILPNFTFQP